MACGKLGELWDGFVEIVWEDSGLKKAFIETWRPFFKLLGIDGYNVFPTNVQMSSLYEQLEKDPQLPKVIIAAKISNRRISDDMRTFPITSAYAGIKRYFNYVSRLTEIDKYGDEISKYSSEVIYRNENKSRDTLIQVIATELSVPINSINIGSIDIYSKSTPDGTDDFFENELYLNDILHNELDYSNTSKLFNKLIDGYTDPYWYYENYQILGDSVILKVYRKLLEYSISYITYRISVDASGCQHQEFYQWTKTYKAYFNRAETFSEIITNTEVQFWPVDDPVGNSWITNVNVCPGNTPYFNDYEGYILDGNWHTKYTHVHSYNEIEQETVISIAKPPDWRAYGYKVRFWYDRSVRYFLYNIEDRRGYIGTPGSFSPVSTANLSVLDSIFKQGINYKMVPVLPIRENNEYVNDTHENYRVIKRAFDIIGYSLEKELVDIFNKGKDDAEAGEGNLDKDIDYAFLTIASNLYSTNQMTKRYLYRTFYELDIVVNTFNDVYDSSYSYNKYIEAITPIVVSNPNPTTDCIGEWKTVYEPPIHSFMFKAGYYGATASLYYIKKENETVASIIGDVKDVNIEFFNNFPHNTINYIAGMYCDDGGVVIGLDERYINYFVITKNITKTLVTKITVYGMIIAHLVPKEATNPNEQGFQIHAVHQVAPDCTDADQKTMKDAFSLPISISILKKFNPYEQQEILKNSTSVSVYCIDRVYLDYYKTPEFVNFVSFVIEAAYWISIIISLGKGEIAAAALKEALIAMLKEVLVQALVTAALKLILRKVDDPVLRAIATAVAAAAMGTYSGGGPELSGIAKTFKMANAVTRSLGTLEEDNRARLQEETDLKTAELDILQEDVEMLREYLNTASIDADDIITAIVEDPVKFRSYNNIRELTRAYGYNSTRDYVENMRESKYLVYI